MPRRSPHRITVRLTAAELARLDQLAALLGRRRSTLLREAAFGLRFEGRLNERLITTLSQCANSLATLARQADRAGGVPAAEELQAALSRVHDALEEILK